MQNVVRAASAALLSHASEYGNGARKGPAHLIAVEGCRHVVGGKSMSGGEIMNSIWQSVMPHDLMASIPAPIIKHESLCTVQEVRAILKELDADGQVDAITHDYHLARTEQIFNEEKSQSQTVQMYYPSAANGAGSRLDPSHTFIVSLVNSGGGEEEDISQQEQWGEKWAQGPLHAISRVIERRTRGRVNVEVALAKILRKRHKPSETAS
jgi:hypothetical protein